MAIELKPCPFCGGPVRKRALENPGFSRVILFMCYECGADVSFNVPAVDVPAQHGHDGPAFEAWNRRAERTCHLEEGYGDAGGNVGKVCSECKTTVEFHWREPPNYCANCGAKVVE